MQTVTSADETRIAFWTSGTGSPLLLVHGATSDHTTTWRFVLPDLENRFTVLNMDRRGRGGSGDGPEYALAREAEDIAAIVDSIGQPVDVVGHSYGGLCAFEAALLTSNIRRLVVYEGVPLDGSEVCPPELVARLEHLLATGQLEELLMIMLREVAELPPAQIELLHAHADAWAVRLRNAGTVPRELHATQCYRFEPARFRDLRIPVLLMAGSISVERELRDARAVADALPVARVGILEGQQHAAMYTAPELFVRELTTFLR